MEILAYCVIALFVFYCGGVIGLRAGKRKIRNDVLEFMEGKRSDELSKRQTELQTKFQIDNDSLTKEELFELAEITTGLKCRYRDSLGLLGIIFEKND